MAIQVKLTGLYGIGALKKLGLDHAMCDGLASKGVSVKLTAKSFSFTKADGSADAEVPVTPGLLQSLQDGSITMTEKLKLKTQVSDAIASLLGGAAKGDGLLQSLPPMGMTKVNMPLSTEPSAAEKLTAALNTAKDAGIKAVQVPPMKPLSAPDAGQLYVELTETKGWPTFPKAQLKSAPLVKLRDASQMYQPVYGTSSGSRYFMVAANADLRVAVKLDSGTLSVRIEGPHWTKYANDIAECGFSNIDKAKGYASLHLHVGDDKKIASKTLGAILAGLGVPLETPIPELKFIYG